MEEDSPDQNTMTLLSNNFIMVQPKDITLFTITKSALENTGILESGWNSPWRGKSWWARWWQHTFQPSFSWSSPTPPPSSSHSSLRRIWVLTWPPFWWWRPFPSARLRACPPPLSPRWSTTGSVSWATLPKWCSSLPWNTWKRINWKKIKSSSATVSLRLENEEGIQLDTKAAWNDPKDKRNKTFLLTLLTMGKFNSLQISTNPQLILKEKGSPLDKCYLIHCLLWYCCMLLFWKVFPLMYNVCLFADPSQQNIHLFERTKV